MMTPTASKRHDAGLAENEEVYRFRTLIDGTLEAVAVHRDGKLIYVNPAAIRLMGAQSADDLLGKPILELVHPDYHAVVQTRLGAISQPDDVTPLLEEKFLRLDGAEVDVEVQSTWIRFGAEPAIQVAARDITLQKAQQRQLEHLAHFDALTNLPNRVLLVDRLQQVMVQMPRHSQILAVVFIDLDGFKAVNDGYGHHVGDQLLIDVATRLRHALREGDSLARLGGDEFVAVLLDLADVEMTEPMLNRLLLAVKRPFLVYGHDLSISASLGVSFFPQSPAVEAGQLLRQADQAMYQAKLAGKNRFVVFDAELDHNLREHHEKVQQIRRAIAQNEFVLHYQPKVNLRSGEVFGVEALVRWQHPVKGLLMPGSFLPLIENHVLSVDLGELVIDAALCQIERWKAEQLDLVVSVNVGTHQLRQPNFAERVRALLAAHPSVKPASLEIELSETYSLQDMSVATRVITSCGQLGVRFALARFGAGAYSLAYLQNLPVKLLKIDQRFLRDLLNGPDNLAILENVIGLAAAFHCQVMAEGVETDEQIAKLLQLGCELAQGYGIARPMPAQELAGWMAVWRSNPVKTHLTALRRHDDSLLYAAAEHSAWITAIRNYVRGERATPPGLDPQQCHFGQWLSGHGLARHGAKEAFVQITGLHQRSHALAERLCELKVQGRVQEALNEMSLLQSKGDALIERLKTLAES